MKLHKGFTLIELMIVVIIVTIIASFGYPSYIQHTTKARRASAESFMLTVANKQEQYMLDARNYAATLATLNLTTPTDVAANYTITIGNASNTTYTITATPIGNQLTNDTKCPSLTLDQTGSKSPATGCW
jgi:type IV pilus assembly protein PilE